MGRRQRRWRSTRGGTIPNADGSPPLLLPPGPRLLSEIRILPVHGGKAVGGFRTSSSSLTSLVRRHAMLNSRRVNKLAEKKSNKRRKAELEEMRSYPAARAALLRAITAFLESSGITRTLAAIRSQARLEPKTVNAFQRVKNGQVKFADERRRDNSYWAKAGADIGHGAKPQEVLNQVNKKSLTLRGVC
ncbi:hypothetical protein Taro_034394 [Colocasia esculenta]|uniref:Uncharacterized protein n=1 Tax=Colocasia esculenta TaxID=4460 RepID=A0A843WBT3_COLES|nr:hypothetical protein [Colocasia esculenta]